MKTVKEEEIDLTLPNTGIGIVAMQPYVEIGTESPPRWKEDRKDCQIRKITRVLEIAQQKDHTCEKTHFVLLPEYAVPGLTGVKIIQEAIEDNSWEAGSVIIGGIDGLNKDEFYELCSSDRTHVDPSNTVDKLVGNQWVNCVMTWIKSSATNGDSTVERWIQPKLSPSWPEEDIDTDHMFEGNCIHLFKGNWEGGTAFRFFSLVCYDWIAPYGSNIGAPAILKIINTMWNQDEDPKPLHMVFVPQCNKSPDDLSFLKNAYEYFHGNFQFVARDKSVIVFVNSAGVAHPGSCDQYGHSSLIFHSAACCEKDGSPASYAVCTDLLRGNSALQTCKDLLFRERGESIHSFRLFHPLFVEGMPHRKHPVSPALVHSLDESIQDPRTPGGQVPAVVKWVNDGLDNISNVHDPSGVFEVTIRQEQNRLTNDLRWVNNVKLNMMMISGTENMPSESKVNVDLWSSNEEASLKNMIESLAYISCISTVKVKKALAHGYIIVDGTVIDVMVVAGGEGHTENLKYALSCFPVRRERELLIVSRDRQNGPMTSRDGIFSDARPKFKRCAFHDLQDCLTAATIEEFRKNLRATVGI